MLTFGEPTDALGEPIEPPEEPADPPGEPTETLGEPTLALGEPTDALGEPIEPPGEPREPLEEPELPPGDGIETGGPPEGEDDPPVVWQPATINAAQDARHIPEIRRFAVISVICKHQQSRLQALAYHPGGQRLPKVLDAPISRRVAPCIPRSSGVRSGPPADNGRNAPVPVCFDSGSPATEPDSRI